MGKNQKIRSGRGNRFGSQISDSVAVWRDKRSKKNGEEGKRKKWVSRVDWSDEAIEKFREDTENLALEKGGINEEVEELIRKIKDKIRVRKKRKEEEVKKNWR